jgi:sugar lactone lactonase YvrE
LSSTFAQPAALAFDAADNLFVAEQDGNRIRRISSAGTVTTLAGSTTGASGTANGNGTAASFNSPLGLTVDPLGNVWVAEFVGNRLRKIDSAGNVTTVTTALNAPRSVAYDSSGDLFVADGGSGRIKRVTQAGAVTDFTATTFSTPTGLANDPAGNLYLTEFSGHRIRRITPAGVVTTLTGTGTGTSTDGPGTTATTNAPHAITRTTSGTLVFVEYTGNRVRTLSPAGSGALSVAWTAPANNGGSAITDYRVEYRTSPSGTWTVFSDGVSTATTTTITGLTNGTAYDVRISAINAIGTGSASTAVTATPGVAPGAPTGLIVTSASGQLTATWTAPADNGGAAVSDYAVEYRTSPSGTWTVFPDGVSSATTATITGLASATTYEVRIRAVNSFDCGSPSSTASATTP